MIGLLAGLDKWLFWSNFFKQKTAYEISACLVGSEMCIRDRLIVRFAISKNVFWRPMPFKDKYSSNASSMVKVETAVPI